MMQSVIIVVQGFGSEHGGGGFQQCKSVEALRYRGLAAQAVSVLLSVCPSVCPSVRPSVHLSVCLPSYVCLSVFSVCIAGWLAGCLTLHLSFGR